MHHIGDGDLPQPLHLGHDGLAVVEALGVLQADLATPGAEDRDHLVMTSVLDLGVEAEIEDGPAESRGRGVKTGSKEVETDHDELFICKVGIAGSLLCQKHVHEVSGIVLLEV